MSEPSEPHLSRRSRTSAQTTALSLGLSIAAAALATFSTSPAQANRTTGKAAAPATPYVHPYFRAEKVCVGPVRTGNPTAEILAERIRRDGRLSFSEVMATALYGPHGYYARGRAFSGIAHDFVTAPSRSRLFGGVVAEALGDVWEQMGRPGRFTLLEHGAGGAHLASALLEHAARVNPDFFRAIRYVINEHAAGMISKQRNALRNHQGKVSWLQGSATAIALAPFEGASVSNEVPDAFPVDRVMFRDGRLKQKYLTLEERGGLRFFVETWGEPTLEVQAYADKYRGEVTDYAEWAVNPGALRFQEEQAQVVKRGAILTIDYGIMNGRRLAAGEQSQEPQKGPFQGAVRVYRRRQRQGEPNVVGAKPPQLMKMYQLLGDIDITSDPSFDDMATLLTQRGFELAHFGTQESFQNRWGLQEMAANLIRFTLAGDPIEMTRAIDAYFHLQSPFGSGCGALLATKGIDSARLMQQPRTQSHADGATIPLPIPDNPTRELFFHHDTAAGRGRPIDYDPSTSTAQVPLTLLGKGTVCDAEGSILLDLSQPGVRAAILHHF